MARSPNVEGLHGPDSDLWRLPVKWLRFFFKLCELRKGGTPGRKQLYRLFKTRQARDEIAARYAGRTRPMALA